MARSASSKRSSAKKTPAKTKKNTAPSRKAAKTKKRSGAPRGGGKAAKGAKGKPRTASTRKHGGASKAPKRSPKTNAKRAKKTATSPATPQPAQTTDGGGETPGAHRQERIVVRNVNVPGYRNSVDATKYEAMRSSLMAALPATPPGLTQNEMLEAVLPKLPQEHFPRGDKAMWWIKTVQLDQEARGAMKRSDTKPLRWWRT